MRAYRLKTTKKVFVLASIAALQFVLLFFYLINEDFITNFKAVYLSEIYLPIYESKIGVLMNEKPSQIKPVSTAEKANSIPILLYHGIVDLSLIHISEPTRPY
jgi:hypothetical protein